MTCHIGYQGDVLYDFSYTAVRAGLLGEVIRAMATRFYLAELLQAAGMTQTELHRKSGVAYSTINGMVLNKARQVSLDTLDAISAALGCEPGDLVVRSGRGRRA